MFSIRRATSEDVAQVLACLRAAFEDYRKQYTPEGFLDTVLTPETFQERLEAMIVFAAVNDSGEVAGTIACNLVSAAEGHLRGMAVLPSLRGSGIAGQLLRHAEEELRSRKCARITLDTTEPLQRAMGFYEKHGYRRSGKVSDFFGMPLVEYQKVLLPADGSGD
jgi:ribosomal protein S18 acetylase RimI-like enzyme